MATVVLGERSLRFHQEPSSVGQSYSSAEGTVIIDGTFVAIVLPNDLGFERCHIVAQQE